jgi:hypothetical protein
MTGAKFETINSEILTGVIGGKGNDDGRGFWDRMKNLGKAAVNGVYNVIPDKITSVGGKGGSVEGSWDKRKNLGDKPFKDDPLAKFRGDR